MPILTTQSARSYGLGQFLSTSADFVKIYSTTVTGSATSGINFASIPQTYSSIWIVGNAVSTTGAPNFNWNYNGVGTGYNYLYMENATSGNNASTTYALGGTVGVNGGSVIVKIPDYARTDKYKSATIQTATETYVSTIGNVWQSTNAISSINFFLAGTTFAVGSSLTLYGLK